jgi:hypothetical protein
MDSMMNKNTYTIIAAALFLLSSCKMMSPRQESWSNPAFEGRTLGKTMVLATAESVVRSRQYEAIFVDRLLPYVEAGSLHASQDVTGKIEKDSLEGLLKSNGVKTIIVTSVLDEKSRDELVSIGYNATPYDNGYWGYYSFGYALSANTATVSSYIEYVLETNIYDVETKQLVWSGRKSIFDDRSDISNMELIIKTVIRDIQNKGMLD